MSDKSAASEPAVHNAATKSEINLVGAYFVIAAVVLLYVLIASWPVAEVKAGSPVGFKPFRLLGLYADWEADKRMLFTVVIAGAIGSLVHALTSFADFVGNRRFSANWLWWYGVRLPIGSALAIFFYFIVRGGLLLPTVPTGTTVDLQASTLALNPYAIAAFAALAGMFAKNASDKLSEVFDAVMSRKDPVNRADALRGGTGLKIDPEKLTKDRREDLTVTGRGFKKETEVKVNGDKRSFDLVSDTVIRVKLTPADVAKAGQIELSIKNPNEAELKRMIDVAEPAAVKPEITRTDPDLKAGMKPVPLLVVTGKNFVKGCTAMVNDEARTPDFSSASEIKVQLVDKDVATAAPVKLAVRNPDPGGLTSAVVNVEVKPA